MSALTQWYSDDEIEEEEAALAEPRRLPAPHVLGLPTARSSGDGPSAPASHWNVLTPELVAYPPAHKRIFLEREFFPDGDNALAYLPERQRSPRRAEGATSTGSRGEERSYGELWLEAERARLRGLGRPGEAAGWPLQAHLRPGGESRRSQPSSTDALGELRLPTHRARRATPQRVARTATLRPSSPASAALTEPRGLRRLLPGVATLAALVGLWAGASALSGLHHPATAHLKGAVPTASGYLYTVRAGDTLWSIAQAVQPNGDPRVLVDRFEQELNARPLVPGERLLVP